MRQYTFQTKNGFKINTSSKELKDLALAWILVSIAFAIAQIQGIGSGLIEILIMVSISAITVGTGFILHEMAHKIVAQKYHCWAEFRADKSMLIAGILMSFLGFIFIAPGAVIIFGHVDLKQNGKISLAGPLTNIILAIILLPLLFINIKNILISQIVSSGYIINAWLGIFNMIPLWNFDGQKIYKWNKKTYFTTLIVAAVLIFIFFMKAQT
jgi:Zn-dependent protease